MTTLFDKILSDHLQKKFMKYGMFLILKTSQSCCQAVATQHATL